MSRNRLAGIFNISRAPGNPSPQAGAFVPCPAGFIPNAQQQWIYQKAYEQAQEEAALVARTQWMYVFSLN
jgi:hypothetical protein